MGVVEGNVAGGSFPALLLDAIPLGWLRVVCHPVLGSPLMAVLTPLVPEPGACSHVGADVLLPTHHWRFIVNVSKPTAILSNLSKAERDEYDHWWEVASRGGGGPIHHMAMRHVARLRRKAVGDK